MSARSEAARLFYDYQDDSNVITKPERIPLPVLAGSEDGCSFGMRCAVLPMNRLLLTQLTEAVTMAVGDHMVTRNNSSLDQICNTPHFREILSVASKCAPCWKIIQDTSRYNLKADHEKSRSLG